MPLNSKKSILITRFPFESILSGEEWHTIHLAEELRSRGHDVFFLGSCDVLLREFDKRQITSYKAWGGPSPVTKENVVQFMLLQKFLKVHYENLLEEVHRESPITTIYMLSLSEKILLTEKALSMGITPVWVEHQRFGNWMYKNPLKPHYQELAQKAHIIGVSPEFPECMTNLDIPDSSYEVITNGIDETLFHTTRPLFPKQQGEFVFGTVARLYNDKGLDNLIIAFKYLLKEPLQKKFRLCILGEGPEEPHLKKLVKELHIENSVTFLSPYTDISRTALPSYYSYLDTFVLPSRFHDPFGLVVAEAMACSVPTIITDVCGIGKFLDNKKNTYIVEAENIPALTSAMKHMAQDTSLRSFLTVQGRMTALSKFTLSRMVDEYERCL